MRLRAVGGIALALVMVACGADYVEQGKSTVLLVLQSITSGSGGAPILADVRTGEQNDSITNCVASVGMALFLKNPNNPGNPTETVVLQRYDVSYVRSDGRAVEGVDVPYRFSEPMTASITPGETATVSIDIVRHQAFLEQPLSQIAAGSIVEITANVTFYGETVSRQTVSASGAVSIRFADYVQGTQTCQSGS
jgi:hypothetical protein